MAAQWELIGPLLVTVRGQPDRENRGYLDGIQSPVREGTSSW